MTVETDIITGHGRSATGDELIDVKECGHGMRVRGKEDECGNLESLADFGSPPREAISDDTRDGVGP